MTRPTTSRFGACVGLVVAFVLLGMHAHRVLIRDGPPLHADEAGHTLPAARMALALGQGDLRGFASASLRELVLPSWELLERDGKEPDVELLPAST